jgi:hypothetical protein
MKLLASLAFGTATLVASTFGLAQPAMAHDDDVTVGVRLGPLCVGLCIGGGGGGGDHRGHGSRDRGDECYDFDCDGTGFYSHRDYYHQRYDRRDTYDDYAEYRDDGYAGYRRHGGNGSGGHHGKRHGHHDRDDDDGGDD